MNNQLKVLNEEKQVEVFLKMFEQELVFGKHHEDQRAVITNLIMALAAAITAIVVFDGKISCIDLPLTILISFLGVMGVIFTGKHFERAEMHWRKALNYKNVIDIFLPSTAELFENFQNVKNDKDADVSINRDILLNEERVRPLASLNLGMDLHYKNAFTNTYGKRMKWLSKIVYHSTLYKLWVLFYGSIILLGLVLTVMAFFNIGK